MRTHTTGNEAVEMYLKTIAELTSDGTPVVIARVAERLGVSPVSAGEMVKRLIEQGYLEHERYKGVLLTSAGQAIASSVIRRQRLWECFLADHLHLNWSGLYETACRLEHATSTVLAEALAAYLGHPDQCPHGNPIPAANGHTAPMAGVSLADWRPGQSGRVTGVLPADTATFVYLERCALLPGRMFTVLDKAPFDGPITLQLGERIVALSQSMAALIYVEPATSDEGSIAQLMAEPATA